MSDTHAAPAGGADAIVSVPVTTPNAADNTPISPSEAARQLSNWRHKRDNPEVAAAEESPAAANDAARAAMADARTEESEAKAEDASPETVPGETTQTVDPAEVPPIEPPRSWTKEDKELFTGLPRETQERLAERERSRETDFLRRQNEAADKLKGLTAKEQQAEQVRQQYEQALPNLLQMLQETQQGEFSDIKTMADVEKLAREDWPRYALWDAQQKKIAAISAEVKASQERQQSDFKRQWSEYASKQDQLLNDRAPELADKSKAEKLTKAAQEYLGDIGFKPEELAQAWNGEASLSLRDHRLQLLILDGVKYREAKAGIAKPAARPVPPVQRPGTSKAPTSAADAEIQSAKTAFDRDPTIKTAAALRLARQRAG